MVMDIFKRMFPRVGRFEGSCGWSKLDVFETCPAKFFWTYVYDGPRVALPPNPAFIKGTRVHENLDLWLNGKHPGLPLEALAMRAELQRLKMFKPRTEESWAFSFPGFDPLPIGFRKGDGVRMKIDALIPGKAATVIDFKTGKNRGAKGEQPVFYGTMVMIREPKTMTVTPEFWYVEHGVIAQGDTITRKELPALKKKFHDRLIKIYQAKEWPAKPNQFCRWCDYSKTKGGPCEKA